MNTSRLCLLNADESENTRLRLRLLTQAAEQRGFQVLTLNSRQLTYRNLPALTHHDALYNVGRGSTLLESLLINPQVTTFYKSNIQVNENDSDSTPYSVLMEKEGLPSPRTIFRLNPFDPELDAHLNYLGGFPLVIKTTHSSGGVGTMLAESKRSFLAQAEFLWKSEIEFIVRQYLRPAAIYRVVTLGGKVIATHQKQLRIDDFRSGREHRWIEPDEALQGLAINVADRINFAFCGIDILRDSQGKDYVLELNSPHDFTPFVERIDICGMMIDYLRQRQASNP
jgi:hypothetical protein